MIEALTWLEPLRSSLPEINGTGWRGLTGLAESLATLNETAPPPMERFARSQWLLGLRRDMASCGYHEPIGRGGHLWQTLAQFIAGFVDLDLRDAIGPGHGAMVLTEGCTTARARWGPRLKAGELVGIAATERHGGSGIRRIAAQASLHSDGNWLVRGEKCWVSRLNESAGFVLFFRDPDGRPSAAIVDAAQRGLQREVIEPSGLGGWSWGKLHLRDMLVDPVSDLIGAAGQGMAVFRRHFTGFRPLVTATALGAAAGVHTLVTEILAAKCGIGLLRRVHDNALMVLGRTHAEIMAALLATITNSRLVAEGHPYTDLASRVGKAAGVDTAMRSVNELALLVGATGFQRGHPIAKARTDLGGFLYADGIHDSLYRSGGLTLLRQGT